MGVGKTWSSTTNYQTNTSLPLRMQTQSQFAKLKANLPKERAVFDSYHFTSMENGI